MLNLARIADRFAVREGTRLARRPVSIIGSAPPTEDPGGDEPWSNL
jgi:hypothetical protein